MRKPNNGPLARVVEPTVAERLLDAIVGIFPLPAYQVGRRHTDHVYGSLLEWRGEDWYAVCEQDNVAMDQRNPDGFYRCPACGARALDKLPAALQG